MKTKWLVVPMFGAALLFALAGCATNTPSSSGDMGNMPGMDMGTTNGNTNTITTAPGNALGNQPLQAMRMDGVKMFSLTVSQVRWTILSGVQVSAYAYNGQVPGPLVRVNAGERVRIEVKNGLKEPTSVHWHGLDIPNNQDGAAGVTQAAIQPGATYTYEFTVPNTPGTFFYHSHTNADTQQALGLYGAFIIDGPGATPPGISQEQIIETGEWSIQNGKTVPAMDDPGMMPNYFTLNGKSYPSTATINAKVGDKILFRLIGTGQYIHPLHIHGGSFKIVATDGNPVPAAAQLTKDTVLVGPGERYDVVWTAKQPGKWLLHCHINHHTTNNNQETNGGGGMMMVINVAA